MYPKLKGVCEGNSAEAAEFVRLITDLIEETIREQDPLADCADALRQLAAEEALQKFLEGTDDE